MHCELEIIYTLQLSYNLVCFLQEVINVSQGKCWICRWSRIMGLEQIVQYGREIRHYEFPAPLFQLVDWCVCVYVIYFCLSRLRNLWPERHTSWHSHIREFVESDIILCLSQTSSQLFNNYTFLLYIFDIGFQFRHSTYSSTNKDRLARSINPLMLNINTLAHGSPLSVVPTPSLSELR